MTILAKNGQIQAKNDKILTISEFSRHIEYDFLKEHHKTCFHIKNYENLQRRFEDIGQKDQKMAILAKNGQILTIFGQKVTNFEFSTKNEKWRILGILDVQLHEKNQKKYRTVQAVDPGQTDGRE